MEHTEKRKNIIMLAIVTIIVIYIAVSIFGVVSDTESGQTVFVISSGLSQVGDVKGNLPFLDKLKGFFNFPEKVPVPIERKLTIKGQVIYTNGDPFANGLVEMRSDPRKTYTDWSGYFAFDNVKVGQHTFTVYSKNMKALASCTVLIERTPDNQDPILTQLPDGTWVLEISKNIKTLQIVLEIELDASGNANGKLIMSLGDGPPEYYPPEEEIPGGAPDEPGDIPPVIPPIDINPNPPSPPPPAKPWDITVYSKIGADGNFAKRPGAAANINIFGDNKNIAPGMSGKYIFTIDNSANSFPINYAINFIETNNSLNIPMRYRLKNNDTNTYVSGDNKWYPIDEIANITVNPSSPLDLNSAAKTHYTLEWLWQEAGNTDNVYGKDHGGEVACTMTIRVSAQRK